MRPLEIFRHWEQVRKDLIVTIEKFQEDELTFTPSPGAWTAGKVMLHIADTEDYWLHSIVTGELAPDFYYELSEYSSKADILMVLERARRRTTGLLEKLDTQDLEKTYYGPEEGQSLTLYTILWHVIEHEIHHRGELSLMLGLLGRDGLDV